MQQLDRCANAGHARALWLAIALALALAASGCGTVKLHSEVRQKQGEDLAKAWKEVNLKALFEAERANQAKLLETEVAGWSRHAGERYQNELRTLAKMPVGSYRAQYLTLLTELAGPLLDKDDPVTAGKRTFDEVAANVAAALRSVRQEGTATLELARSQSFLKSQRVPSFTCDQLLAKTEIVQAWKAKSGPLALNPNVVAGLASSAKQCSEIAKRRKEYVDVVSNLPGGSLEARVRAWKVDQDRLQQRRTAVDDATIEVQKAQSAYDAAVLTGKLPSDGAKTKANELAKALDALTAAQDVFGIEVASEDRIQRIDDLLKSLEEGKELSSDTASKVEVAISLFPNIANALKDVAEKKGAASMPLLIQRDVEQAKLSSARVETARLKQEVELRSVVVFATLQQANSVLTALKRLDAVSTSGKALLVSTSSAAQKEREDANKVLNAPNASQEAKNTARAMREKQEAAMLDAVWTKLSPDDRRFVLDSTVFYLDAYARQEIPIQASETTRLAISMDRNVDLSEVNATLWMALINSTVTQAAEYSALGLKASDFEKILSLLGLGYIGHGVNK
jgi:hypothetical protein